MPESSTSLVVTREGPPDELAAVLEQAVRATFGATALITEVVLRALSESAPTRSAAGRQESLPASQAVDVVLGLGWGLAHAADRMAGLAYRVASPALSLVLAPPLVPRKLQPANLLRQVSLGWRAERPDAVRSLYAWSATVAPAASDLALNLLDVDELLVQALGRMDLQQLARAALARLDVDELTTTAMTSLDLNGMVEQVIAELDLTPVVESVVQRMDLEQIVGTALDQLDLTQLILDRVDLLRVADVVVDGVDLPEIIRESTESMAFETVRDVRLHGIEADRAVSRLVDRVLRRPRQEL